MKKHLNITILIVVAVVALAILGYAFWQLIQEDKTFDWQSFSFISHHNNSSADTSDWLTYRNEKYGWEIKYPKIFNLYDCHNNTDPTIPKDYQKGITYFLLQTDVTNAMCYSPNYFPEQIEVFFGEKKEYEDGQLLSWNMEKEFNSIKKNNSDFKDVKVEEYVNKNGYKFKVLSYNLNLRYNETGQVNSDINTKITKYYLLLDKNNAIWVNIFFNPNINNINYKEDYWNTIFIKEEIFYDIVRRVVDSISIK